VAEPYFKDLRAGFTEVPPAGKLKSTNIFYRYSDLKIPGTPDKPAIAFENLQVVEKVMTDARGASAFQLFLTINVVPGEGGRFDFTFTRAEVDARIWVQPRNRYDPLSAFAPMYDAFKAKGASAAEKFLDCHHGEILPDGTVRGGHWSTSFSGIRAKTMRHELDHVAYALSECDGLVSNFTDEARKIGRTSSEWSPTDRIEALMDRLMAPFGFPYFDVGGSEHKRIARRDFFFMVAWYEAFELGLEKKSPEGYDAYIAAITNYQLKYAMAQVGEDFPWL
jgi:hypothetical protein